MLERKEIMPFSVLYSQYNSKYIESWWAIYMFDRIPTMNENMMTTSQKALIKACKNLEIPFEVIHRDSIAVKVFVNNQKLLFIHHHKPFNRSDIQRVTKDKDLSYHLLSDFVSIPKWTPYVDPMIGEKYSQYIRFNSYKEIVDDIEEKYDFPLIIKKNMGSMGTNVFEVGNTDEAHEALKTIYDKESNQYDYVALAQEKVEIKKEYRVIMYKGKALLTYLKDTSNAEFDGNLSPLHWKDSSAVLVKDKELIAEFEEFSSPIFEELDIVYTGLDIAVDTKGQKWLIELNGSPAVKQFAETNGDEEIVKMLEYILQDLSSSS